MPSIWPAWATAQNPVFRYETGRWGRSRFRRLLQPALWSGAVFLFLIFVCLPATCAGLLLLAPPTSGLPATDSRLSDFFSAFVLFLAGSGVFSSLASGLLGLAATALAATLIAREREAQTWPLVRLTTLTPGQIVGGKLAAFLHILQNSMHLVAVWRGVTVAAAVGAGLLYLLLSYLGVPEAKSGLQAISATMPPDAGPALAGWGLVGLATVAFWLAEPYYVVIYNGIVGLAVSTFARTRRWAIALVFITQFTLGLAVYWPIQQMAALLPTVIVMLLYQINPKATIDPAVVTLPTIGLQYVVVIVLQVTVMAACLATTLYRAERLSD